MLPRPEQADHCNSAAEQFEKLQIGGAGRRAQIMSGRTAFGHARRPGRRLSCLPREGRHARGFQQTRIRQAVIETHLRLF